ncbi:MAG: LacI family DNA-binding transcriptional regulator [Ilumatobacter sp.]
MTETMHRDSSRPSTLHDVAAVVGVSPRTVSRVVNDQGGFSEATRAKVMAAVTELHYRPNAMARGLITRRSNTVAFIAPVLNDPFFPEVAEAVQRAARTADLTMLFALSNGCVDTEQDVLSRLDAHSPDGVVIFPAGGGADHLHDYLDRGIRMVVIDTVIDHPNATSVMSDLRRGTQLAVERLLNRGCQHLAMIASSSSPVGHRRRQPAFVDSLPDAMEPIVESVVPTYENGRLAMAQLLERAPHIDGVFAYNDVIAIGAIEALRAAGRSIPDDVAIIGCDDIEMGALLTPSLSSIRIDRERLGHEAVRALVALTENEPIDSPSVLPVELVLRDSG